MVGREIRNVGSSVCWWYIRHVLNIASTFVSFYKPLFTAQCMAEAGKPNKNQTWAKRKTKVSAKCMKNSTIKSLLIHMKKNDDSRNLATMSMCVCVCATLAKTRFLISHNKTEKNAFTTSECIRASKPIETAEISHV